MGKKNCNETEYYYYTDPRHDAFLPSSWKENAIFFSAADLITLKEGYLFKLYLIKNISYNLRMGDLLNQENITLTSQMAILSDGSQIR